MDHTEVTINHNAGKSFAISASMVIASAILWGLYGTFVTILTSMGLSRNALVFLRMLGTSIPVGLLICATDRKAFRVRKADIPLFLCNGLLSLLFFTFCYTAAIKVTKIATAAALLYTAPAIVMVLSAILFHEKMNARKVFCCLLAVVGCAFASGLGGELFAGGAASGSLITPAGLLLGLGAGLGYALYSIFSRIILNRGYSVYTNVFYSFGVAMLGFFVLSVMDGSIGQVSCTSVRPPHRKLCLCALYDRYEGHGDFPRGAAHHDRASHGRPPRQPSLPPAPFFLGDRGDRDGCRLCRAHECGRLTISNAIEAAAILIYSAHRLAHVSACAALHKHAAYVLSYSLRHL